MGSKFKRYFENCGEIFLKTLLSLFSFILGLMGSSQALEKEIGTELKGHKKFLQCESN